MASTRAGGDPRARRRARVGAVVFVSLCLVACSDNDDETGGDESDAGAVTTACDRLEDLGNAILDVPETASPEEIESAVQPVLAAFLEAAEVSGDDRLVQLATTANDAFLTYLTPDGIDAREAGNDADIALDRSIERCLELGATNDFPQEPNP